MLLLALKKSGVKVIDITPLQVKQAVAGYGRAEKTQVQNGKSFAKSKRNPRPDDAADALAVALATGSMLYSNRDRVPFRGKLLEADLNTIIIDVSGVGYLVHPSASVFAKKFNSGRKD